MTQTLADKTALVTGSTSGIGLAIARRLAADGANVVLNGLGSKSEIQAALETVRKNASGDIEFHGADMRDPKAIENMISAVEDDKGCVDILVNNAGIQHVAPIDEFPPERWDDIIAINLSSVFHAVRCALPRMKQSGWGRIINIASAHALVASPYKTAYVAAKHGVAGLTKTAALEVAKHGITVNAIAPGFVDTPLVEKQLDDAAKAHGKSRDTIYEEVVVAAQPTGRLVEQQDIAELAYYLCTEAAKSMTGTILPIDGGWTAK